jgi:drug/metabolite transporter (DMT)-like permease
VAGLASGIFLILIDQASDISVLWPVVTARLASISFVVVAAILLKQGGIPNMALLPIMALAGILEVGGSTLFAFAARSGRLDISAILASLYPAVTVMLAWIILKERLAWKQWLGLVAALAAVILIAL